MTKSKIYTRSGDGGTTSLVGGERVAKADPRLEAYGTLDELSAHIGALLYEEGVECLKEELLRAQRNLFSLSSVLATPPQSRRTEDDGGFMERELHDMEDALDRLSSQLPPWKGFILPGGGRAAAQAHICRTVCRRAERRVLSLPSEQQLDAVAMAYLNRMSDFFFLAARKIAILSGEEEILWAKSSYVKK